MVTVPETTSPSKTLISERVHPADRGSDHSGIVLRFSVSGHVEVEILTDQSDEEDTLRQRLTMAGPALASLKKTFMLDPVTNQESR